MSTSASLPTSTTSTAPPPVVFITGNAKKLGEVKAILADVIPDLQSFNIDGTHLPLPSSAPPVRLYFP
jgi:hypothetical protein